MAWLLDPFDTAFMVRALIGGIAVALICAVVGTWVVIRGMAFLGEAMAHGMLPGVALASLLGAPAVLGAAISAVAMSVGVSALGRKGRHSQDTSIGLLFVGMLALGVIIVSHSQSFATDLTAILFGDVLAITEDDLWLLGTALFITCAIAATFHRGFVALSFDRRIARTLGLKPALSQALLVGLVTLAVVASYGAVGSLLVVGLLLAPAVSAGFWAHRIPTIMVLAGGFGAASVITGLLLSWHVGTAAGATIAGSAIALAAVSAATRALLSRIADILGVSRATRHTLADRYPHNPRKVPRAPSLHQNPDHPGDNARPSLRDGVLR